MEPRLSYVIGRLDHVLRRRISEVVEQHGLTVSQYTALSVLRTRPGLSNARLARRTLITPQSMNEVLAQLDAPKLVRRRPDPGHARAITTHLTDRDARVRGRAPAGDAGRVRAPARRGALDIGWTL